MNEIRGLRLPKNIEVMIAQLTYLYGDSPIDVVRHILIEQVPLYVKELSEAIANFNATEKAKVQLEMVTTKTDEFYRNHTT